MSRKENQTGTAVYLSHGGGPLPILGDSSHLAMVNFMKKLPGMFEKPDAVLVISAHWEEQVPAVINSAAPSLLFDYYGFPQQAYEIEYRAPGEPGLAATVKELLETAGFSTGNESVRGIDHGVFIPMMLMYPEADIPVVQLSLIRGLSPKAHIAMGKALSPLMNRNIVIIGSGFSFHNMQKFTFGRGNEADPVNDSFQDWIIDTASGSHGRDERERLLTEWTDAPGARYCHPREEHLLPLHVCSGLSSSPAEVIFDDYIAGKRAVALKWGR